MLKRRRSHLLRHRTTTETLVQRAEGHIYVIDKVLTPKILLESKVFCRETGTYHKKHRGSREKKSKKIVNYRGVYSSTGNRTPAFRV